MIELLFFTVLIYLFLSRTKKRKKARGLDAELRELVESSNDATGIGLDIKRFLLSVIDDDNNDDANTILFVALLITLFFFSYLRIILPFPLSHCPK